MLRLLLVGLLLPVASALAAPGAPPATVPATAPASQPAPARDPFGRLKLVTPIGRLPPLSSVRIRDKREQQDRSREGEIIVSIGSSPTGLAVYYGGRLLGKTPLALKATRGSTPFDVVLRARGYMTLRTRIFRKTSRSYFFKLTPAKIR